MKTGGKRRNETMPAPVKDFSFKHPHRFYVTPDGKLIVVWTVDGKNRTCDVMGITGADTE